MTAFNIEDTSRMFNLMCRITTNIKKSFEKGHIPDDENDWGWETLENISYIYKNGETLYAINWENSIVYVNEENSYRGDGYKQMVLDAKNIDTVVKLADSIR